MIIKAVFTTFSSLSYNTHELNHNEPTKKQFKNQDQQKT